MGKKSRTKGAAFERVACKIFSLFWPFVSRNLKQYQRSDGRDFDGTEPISIQAKWHKKITAGVIKKALAEAQSACDADYRYYAAITKEDGEEPIFHMPAKDLVEWQCLIEDGEL